MPTLHGANLSPFVRKVRVALAIKGIEYDQVPVIPFAAPDDFKSISPLGKIPVYEVDGHPIPDSSVIIDYLEHVQPTPALYPSDPLDRARALFYEEYADTRLTEALGPVFFQGFVRPRFFNEEPDAGLIKEALEVNGPVAFDYFEGQVDEAGFLVGDSFSIADIAAGSPFVNFALGGGTLDADRWPKLAAYVERVHGHPAYKPIVEEDLAAGG